MNAEPDNESAVDEIWRDDLLGRKQDARFIADFIAGQIDVRRKTDRVASYVLNIDSPWGGGKSFFMERFADQLRADGHLVAEINAWRDDHSDDPLISLMSAIESVLAPYLKKERTVAKAWKGAKTNGVRIAGKIAVATAKTAFKRYVGQGIEELVDAHSAEGSTSATNSDVIGSALEEATKEISSLTDKAADALIEKFNAANKSISGFRENMGEIAATLENVGIKPPFYVLVDELDRCRPTYAISLLERAKHLFETDGVAFVFSTDAGQLQHTVRGVYGGEFDGKGYLTRFFDRRYAFSEPDTEQFVASRIGDIDIDKVYGGFEGVVETFIHGIQALWPIPLRDVERIIDIIAATVSAWTSDIKIDAATLLLLSACYQTRQDFDLSAMYREKQGRWIFEVSGDWRRQPESVDVFAVTLDLMEIAKNLSNAISGNAGDTLRDRHIRTYLSAEFNARPRRQNGPSLLHDLPQLISNAGRILNDSGSR